MAALLPCTELRHAVGHCVTSLAPFRGDGTNTLQLREGEKLLLLHVQNDGWARGRQLSGRGSSRGQALEVVVWADRTVTVWA